MPAVGKSWGQQAYESYYESLGGRGILGEELPDWYSLEPEAAARWEARRLAVPGPHRMAREVRIVRDGIGKAARMYIDGELFPYYTSDGYGLHPKRAELPSVSFTLVAERVIVTDQVDATAAGEDSRA